MTNKQYLINKLGLSPFITDNELISCYYVCEEIANADARCIAADSCEECQRSWLAKKYPTTKTQVNGLQPR